MLKLEERKRALRRIGVRGVAVLGVGAIGALGTYTGIRRHCDIVDTIMGEMGEMAGDPKVSRKASALCVGLGTILRISHGLGHMLRDEMDKSDAKHVMQEFKKAMQTEGSAGGSAEEGA